MISQSGGDFGSGRILRDARQLLESRFGP